MTHHDLSQGRLDTVPEPLEDDDLVQQMSAAFLLDDSSFTRPQKVELQRAAGSHAGQALSQVLHLGHDAVEDCRSARDSAVEDLILGLGERRAECGER